MLCAGPEVFGVDVVTVERSSELVKFSGCGFVEDERESENLEQCFAPQFLAPDKLVAELIGEHEAGGVAGGGVQILTGPR